MVSLRSFAVAAVLYGVLGSGSGAQGAQIDLQQQNTKQQPGARTGLPPLGPELPESLREKQERARNEDRQKRLKADTEKLLTLATQLHDDVAKTDKNVLSLDVIRRSEEIEKLARGIKERMRG